ncbi:hypothetical protein P692DRAFT_20835480 [Suillus brevipes Sb2]|nr:hypothetical protein P692DRAFT_20835480 [Suillus brevipes Sb2]
MAVVVAVLFLVLKQNFVWFGAWLMLPNVIGNCLLASFNRRLLLLETRSASRGNIESGMNTLVFRAEHSQAYLLENSRHLCGERLQQAEHSVDQGQGRVSEPAVVGMRV